MREHNQLLITMLSCCVIAMAGCGQAQDAGSSSSKGNGVLAAQQSPFIIDTSIHDLMVSVVDPAADAVWQSVSTTVTIDSVEHVQPHTEEDWQALRNQAVILMEAGNLLAMTGRPVVHAGKQLEKEGLYGNLTSAEIQQLVDNNPQQFIAFSQDLYHATAGVLQAIDNRDADAVFELGNSIYEVCEGCHSVFWYPNQELPPGNN